MAGAAKPWSWPAMALSSSSEGFSAVRRTRCPARARQCHPELLIQLGRLGNVRDALDGDLVHPASAKELPGVRGRRLLGMPPCPVVGKCGADGLLRLQAHAFIVGTLRTSPPRTWVKGPLGNLL